MKTYFRLILCLVTLVLGSNLCYAAEEDWKFNGVTNADITPEKPYLEIDIKYGNVADSDDSYVKDAYIVFSGYNEVVVLSGLINNTGGKEYEEDGSWYTHRSTNFLVELYDPHKGVGVNEDSDKSRYVYVRIYPLFPIVPGTQIKATIYVDWVRDAGDGIVKSYDKFFSSNKVDPTTNIIYEDLYPKAGNFSYNGSNVLYESATLADIWPYFSPIDPKPSVKRYIDIDIDGKNEYWNAFIGTSQTTDSEEFELDNYGINHTIDEIHIIELIRSYEWGTYTAEFVQHHTHTLKGFAYPEDLRAEIDKWNKNITLKWNKISSQELKTDGTWEIQRNGVTIASGLEYSTSHFIDNDEALEYNKEYNYTVYFRPSILNNDFYAPGLSATTNEKIIIEDVNIYLTATPHENHIMLNWTHDALSGGKTYSYTIQRKVNDDQDWSDISSASNLSLNKSSYSYKDTDIGSACDIITYRIMMEESGGHTFYSDSITEHITGQTRVTSFVTSRGEYSNSVHISWEVDQIGTENSEFILYRKLLNNEDSEWSKVASFKDTESTYRFEDEKALSGLFYKYKLVAVTPCDEISIESTYYSDGFATSSGSINGRVTYGTGTAVKDVKVAAVKADNDDNNSNNQFYSLEINKKGGVVSSLSKEKAKTLFTNTDFSIQAWVNLDATYTSNETLVDIDEPIIARLVNVWQLSAKQSKEEKNKFDLIISDTPVKKDDKVTFTSTNFEGISLDANKFYHLTLTYSKQDYKWIIYVIDDNGIQSDTVTAGKIENLDNALLLVR